MNKLCEEALTKVDVLEACLFELARQRAMARSADQDPGLVSDASYVAGMLLGVRQFVYQIEE